RHNDEGRDSASDGRAAVEERGGETTFTLGKPFGNGFGRAGPVCRFAQATQKTKAGKTAEACGERRGYGNDRVEEDREAESPTSAHAIDDAAAGRLPQGIGDTETDQQIGVVGVRPVVVADKVGGKVGERLTIDIVNDG